MGRDHIAEADYVLLSERFGIPVNEVKRAVSSFFSIISISATKLPFNNRRKIFFRDKFSEYVSVWNIPGVGRIGPVYSRYLKWRSNEAKSFEQKARSSFSARISQDEIEHMAGEILSGRTPRPVQKKKGSEMFDRVWLVGKCGKRSARQVIPKKKDNVQD